MIRKASFLLFLLLLAACATPFRRAEEAQQSTPPFRPPAQEQPPTATPGAPVNHTPTAEPCRDLLSFLGDLTIPDGTEVQPDSTLDKRWEVQNSGNCNWSDAYRVRLTAGPDLGAQPEQALYPARSGSRAVIRMVFKAPREPGTYRSAWQAFNPQGEPFGDPFFIEIIVP